MLGLTTLLGPLVWALKVTRESLATFIHEMNLLKYIDAEPTTANGAEERPSGIDRLNLSSLCSDDTSEVACTPDVPSLFDHQISPIGKAPEALQLNEGPKTPGRNKLPPPSPRPLSAREWTVHEDFKSPRTPHTLDEKAGSLTSPRATKFPPLSPRAVLSSIENSPSSVLNNEKEELYGSPLLGRLGEPAYSSTPKQNGHSHNHSNGSNGHHFDDRSFERKALSFDTSSSSSADSSSTMGDSSGIARLTKGVNVSSILDEDDLNVSYKPSPTAGRAADSAHFRWLPQPPPSIQNKLAHHPRFHFPQGKAVPKAEIDAALRRAGEVFRKLPGMVATYDDMHEIVTAFGLPLYWKKPIWDQVARGRSRVEQKDFSAWWWNLTTVAHDEAARFVHVLSHGGRSYLVEGDFHSLVLDLIHTHPGLEFYRKSEEFHEKFIQVIVTRIFWSVNRSWSGKITAAELRRAKLLDNIRELERTEDVNQLTEFFSYEHFYVVYCKFWEIDSDHDMEITREDLLRHTDHAILPLVVDRIFSGAVTRGHNTSNRPTRDLAAFTAFLLADEDKNHPTSIEYWFRVLDLDGDGRISLLEMETFYNQLVKTITQFGIDTMTFSDLACNLFDMIEPASGKDFTLADLKKSKMAGRFFNAFVNWRKFYQQESSEGEKTSVKGTGDEELSDWDRFCMEEYEQMMEADEDNDENVDDAYSVTLDD